MKKLIVLLLLIIFSFSAAAQIEYPRYEKDSLGQLVVVMTVKQAQTLDNNSDLLILFKNLDEQILNYDILCIKVIGEKDDIIAKQTVQINKLKETLLIKGEEINNLQKRIDEKDAEITNLNSELTNKNDEIGLHKKEIKKGKIKAFMLGSVGGFLLGAVLILIAI